MFDTTLNMPLTSFFRLLFYFQDLDLDFDLNLDFIGYPFLLN